MKFYLFIFILLFSNLSSAEWIKLVEGESGIIHFIDSDTILNEGDRYKVWIIGNKSIRGSNGELSTKTREEYDCKKAIFRILFVTEHSELMAKGKIVASESNGPWGEIPPDSVAAFILKLLCKK
jgi:hypothetical protein